MFCCIGLLVFFSVVVASFQFPWILQQRKKEPLVAVGTSSVTIDTSSSTNILQMPNAVRMLILSRRDDPANQPILDLSLRNELLLQSSSISSSSSSKLSSVFEGNIHVMMEPFDPTLLLYHDDDNDDDDDDDSDESSPTAVLDSLVEHCNEYQINTIFVAAGSSSRDVLSHLVSHVPTIQWIHTRSAGIDHIVSPTLIAWYNNLDNNDNNNNNNNSSCVGYSEDGSNTIDDQQSSLLSSSSPSSLSRMQECPHPRPRRRHGPVIMTNAKGCYSSTLAEYTMMAIGYFAKDIPRLLSSYSTLSWDPYLVREIRGSTLGIVGYGSIGQASAQLALSYGMNIIALTRTRTTAAAATTTTASAEAASVVVYAMEDDETPNQHLNRIFEESDYVLCTLPITNQTRNLIGMDQFTRLGTDGVFINVGRGPVVNEDDLILALQNDVIRGAALDVMTIEPLPISSTLWHMPTKVLLSPHNMDNTATFLLESTTFFVQELLPRFVLGQQPLINQVDPTQGY
jgi:phosphoglycerate dehydrogenase-like enzyme